MSKLILTKKFDKVMHELDTYERLIDSKMKNLVGHIFDGASSHEFKRFLIKMFNKKNDNMFWLSEPWEGEYYVFSAASEKDIISNLKSLLPNAKEKAEYNEQEKQDDINKLYGLKDNYEKLLASITNQIETLENK